MIKAGRPAPAVPFNQRHDRKRFVALMRAKRGFALRRKQRGFTLVELLVVIAIIAILAAILSVAVGAALRFMTSFTVGMELKELEMALTQYNSKYGSYPPSMGVDAAYVQRHVQTAFRNNRENWTNISASSVPMMNAADNDTYDDTYPEIDNATLANLDASEALPFFLGGAAKYWSERGCGNLIGLKNDPISPLTGSRLSSAVSYYDFKADQLVDLDGDGFPSYIPNRAEGGTPFIYFAAHVYRDAGTPAAVPAARSLVCWPPGNTSNPTATGPGLYGAWIQGTLPNVEGGYDPGVVRPYLNGKNEWHNEDSYQLLSAGVDGFYGSDGRLDDGSADADYTRDLADATVRAQYKAIDQNVWGNPTTAGVWGNRMPKEDEDNISNFVGEGQTFGEVGME